MNRRQPLSPSDVLTGGVSVVIACHSENRLDLLQRSVTSALAQDVTPLEVVIAVDNNDPLYLKLRTLYRVHPRVKVVANTGVRGASSTRNAGVRAARSPLVAFLDDDVVAAPSWLRRLIAPLGEPSVAGTGGSASPRWQTGKPRWFPDEFLWVVGASFKGMPTSQAEVRNVWSENMAIRRAQFLACGGFDEGFGKRLDVSRPEDTEMCIRFARRSGDHWLYVPDARVEHFVPTGRSSFRFFLARCFSEGRGKIEMRRLTHERLSSERAYALRTVPTALGRCLWQVVSGDFAAVLRFAAVLAGCFAALAGAVHAALHSPAAKAAPAAGDDVPVPEERSRAG
ncbi:MAG TPA: glycosyltransferase family 2 protein [Mycobacteriales bacterium]|nr:glycosyltransferase family 2 protein [Mycobacteriales bacterium]